MIAPPIKILLVEDHPGDVLLTRKALEAGHFTNDLSVVGDGVEALAYLRKQGEYVNVETPGIILLDLKLPRMNGFEFLARMKQDPDLKRLPVIVMSSSTADIDILKSYELRANAYITKPVDLTEFTTAIKGLGDFWFSIVRLPRTI